MCAIVLKFVGILFLVGLVAGADLQRRQIQTRETNSCMERQAPGTICESCELLATCVKLATGWVNIPVESCDTRKGYYCNANLAACSNTTGPCHPFGFEGNFPCTTQGIFPDPYDCQRYHMCYFVEATLVSASVDCGGGRAFDVTTGQCSLSLQDAVCHEKQFVCTNAGDAQPWPQNPNIFYVCKATSNEKQRVLYPTLYRCDAGDVFNGFYCISSGSESEESPIDWPTEEPGVVGSSVGTTTRATNAFNCTQRRGLFADPENCQMYYYCSGITDGKLIHNKCPQGTYYKDTISSCSPGTCSNANKSSDLI